MQYVAYRCWMLYEKVGICAKWIKFLPGSYSLLYFYQMAAMEKLKTFNYLRSKKEMFR